MVGIQEHGMHIRRKTCIEVRTFQRILNESSKLEPDFYLYFRATPHNGSGGLRRIFCPNRAV